jgi:hypothetical protein
MSTQWIYDRRPTFGDFGLHGLVWLWSRVNARALLCPYIAKSRVCPWAPGHQPAPTAAPSPAPEPIDADFFPPKEIPEPIRTGACPFYVLVVSDDDAGNPGGYPIVWEHQMPAGTTLQAALQHQQRVAGRYGTTYLAECRIIPETVCHGA